VKKFLKNKIFQKIAKEWGKQEDMGKWVKQSREDS